MPRYNSSNEVHKRLAELGRKASEIAQRIQPQLLDTRGYNGRLKKRGVLMPQEVATLRRDIRGGLEGIIKQIDDLVVELLKIGPRLDHIATHWTFSSDTVKTSLPY